MPESRSAKKGTGKPASKFSDGERSAMRERTLEQKVVWGKNPAEDERLVLAKIAGFPEPDRAMARRLHAILRTAGPELAPRLWYGMPAYTKDGEVLCFFQPAHKFGARYGTLGFNDAARLDEGAMWPTGFALKELTAADEARIAALVKRAVG